MENGRHLKLAEFVGPTEEFYAWMEAQTGLPVKRVRLIEHLDK